MHAYGVPLLTLVLRGGLQQPLNSFRSGAQKRATKGQIALVPSSSPFPLILAKQIQTYHLPGVG